MDLYESMRALLSPIASKNCSLHPTLHSWVYSWILQIDWLMHGEQVHEQHLGTFVCIAPYHSPFLLKQYSSAVEFSELFCFLSCRRIPCIWLGTLPSASLWLTFVHQTALHMTCWLLAHLTSWWFGPSRHARKISLGDLLSCSAGPVDFGVAGVSVNLTCNWQGKR